MKNYFFINISGALIIFVMTVSEAQRAFSKLGNRIKTLQRASTDRERLNCVALLSIENKLASKISFNNIMHSFTANKKQRKKNIINIKYLSSKLNYDMY